MGQMTLDLGQPLDLSGSLEIGGADNGLFGGDIDLEGFNLDEIDTGLDITADNRYVLPPIHHKVRQRAVKYDRAVEFVKDCGQAILDGERVHALLSGNFIFGDVFEAFCEHTKAVIDDLTISTLSISKDNVDGFANLFEFFGLKRLNIIVSDYWWGHNRQNAPYIYNTLDHDDRFQLAVAGTHTKIALIAIGDQRIVAKGSANLRSSRCLEEVTFETDPVLYSFHKEWHDRILDDYGTIKKSVRANALFDKILRGTGGRKKWVVG